MNFLEVYKHLLSDGKAWILSKNKQLTQFFEGLSQLPANVKLFFDLIWLDIFPETTRELEAWEKQWNISSTGTEAERRARLDATWKAKGGQDPRYLQDTMQAAGFNVFIHEWWEPGTEPPLDVKACAVPRNPFLYIFQPGSASASAVACGEPLSLCGEPGALSGATLADPEGYVLVNKIGETVPEYFALCGIPTALSGESDVLCGNFNNYVFRRKEYVLPSDPNKWAYFVYYGGPNFPELATVPKPRRDEFEDLLLKINPLQLWIGVLVEYVALTLRFDTENPGSPTKTIELPIVSGVWTVDWGDGTIDNLNTHEYADAGIKEITITGFTPVTGFSFGGPGGDNEKLIAVLDVTGISFDLGGAFAVCINMEWLTTEPPNSISSMNNQLRLCTNFNADINNWDVSQVTDFAFALADCPNYSQPMDKWDTSSATDMTQLFARNDSFNEDINSWDVSNVTNFFGTIANCILYEQDMSNWDTGNATNMWAMFTECRAFTGQGLSGWNVSNVTNMRSMFGDTDVFNADIEGWDVGNVEIFEDMFRNAIIFNRNLGSWDTSSATDMSNMFGGALAFEGNGLPNWDVSNVTNMQGMFGFSAYNKNIGGWDVRNVTNMANMLDNCAMDTANYDAWLAGLRAQAATLQNGLTLGAQGMTYSPAGAVDRSWLIANKGMTFVGDSPE